MIHKNRRAKLLSRLNAGGLVIIATNPEQIRSGDVHYPFRPHSDFWYLTGFTEPDAVAIFSSKSYHIFLRDKDPVRDIWDGKHLGVEAAPKALKADFSYPITQLKTRLPKLITNTSVLYYDFKPGALDDEIITLLADFEYQSLTPYVHEMRLFKDAEEIKLMQQASDISVAAHKLAMQKTQAGLFEFEITSVLDSHFRKNNAEHAYPPIVAGGENACILHYNDNNQRLKDGDLLLIDAGCEVSGYAADITRTFPINGKFSDAQRQIYQIVLDAQSSAIKSIRPGVAINRPHQIASDIIRQGLIKLDILPHDGNLSQFYMHNTGHWLGLDVHDTPEYKGTTQYHEFIAGMVITVEPGIYIHKDDKIDPIYWGIGIRIEDDVLVTQTSHKVLSAALVKNIDEIEDLVKNEHTTSD